MRKLAHCRCLYDDFCADEEREKTLLTLASLSKCAKQMKKCCRESETDEEREKASQTLA